MPFIICLLVWFSLTSSLLAQPAAKEVLPLVVIKAGKLLDVETGQVKLNQLILVEGDKIKEVVAANTTSLPAGAILIDLSQSTILPGLIDCHTHLTFQPENYYEDIFRRTPIDRAIVAHLYARSTLEAGFTSCRDMGAGELIDVALKKAIDSGRIEGPRLQVSGLPIGATGSHGDLSGFSPYLSFDRLSGIADGAEQIRQKVRFDVKYGADVIKMMATAGVLSEDDTVGGPQYSLEEMKALVEEAAMWGRKVAAHAHGTEGIKRAILAGVTSIEHGSLIDEGAIAMMKQRGTWLVADIYNDDYILSEFARLGYPQKLIDKEKQVGRTQRENFQKAVRAGVKIAFGTDAGVYPHGCNARQFSHMVRWGMTPLEAIQAATIRAAELMGWDQNVGSIRPGKYADLLAVNADPLEDVSTLEKVDFVMKGGKIIKQNGRISGSSKSAN
jgi:imidazolonepropionase-like amidohydrolase